MEEVNRSSNLVYCVSCYFFQQLNRCNNYDVMSRWIKVNLCDIIRYGSLMYQSLLITFLFASRVFIVNNGTLAIILVCCIKYITFRSILHHTRNSLYPLTWDVIGL